jgi:hypothetical protein
MLLCVQPSCTSMAKTKSVTKGVMIKRVLYDTKKTQVKNISHSALPQKYPLKTMPPRHPRPFSAPTPACTCSLWCCLGCRLGGAVEFARPVANCDLYPTPRPKIRQKSHSKNIVATPSPGRSSPRPRVRSLIVVLLRSATGRCGQIRPPGCNLRPLSYPPAQNSTKIPF